MLAVGTQFPAKRVLISYAIEDKDDRDRLGGRRRYDRMPFDFVVMAIRNPWDEQWQIDLRRSIIECDGLIALITKNTPKSYVQLWELKCAKEVGIPIVGMYTTKHYRPASLPFALVGARIIGWTWDDIYAFIDEL